MRDSKSKPAIAEGAEIGRLNSVTERVIGAAIEMHRHLGPGLLESAYEQCLCHELSQAGLRFQRQATVPVAYKAIQIDCASRLDLLVEGEVIVEIKAIDEVLPVHKAQALTYLKASQRRVDLSISFNVPVLKSGLTRIVNRYAGPAPAAHISAAPAAESGKTGGAESLSNSSPRDLRVSAVNGQPASKREPA